MSAILKVEITPPPANLSTLGPVSAQKRILLIGDSGTGKTRFIGTMPKPAVALFDPGGAETLLGKDVIPLYYEGENGWRDFKTELQEWRKGYKWDRETFALDSLTMAADAAMAFVLKKNGRTTSQPTIADWGEAIREVKDVLGIVTTLPGHVVVTAHAQLVKDELLGDLQWLPLIFGKDLPYRLGIWFGDVWHTTVKTEFKGGVQVSEYRLQMKPDQRMRIIKSRMDPDGKIFNFYETPDYPTLVAKAKGAK